jgi:hypothetical protein
LARLLAFVLFPVRGLIRWADRTSLRTTLNDPAARPDAALPHALQPEPMWTITRKLGLPSTRRRARHVSGASLTPQFGNAIAPVPP